MGLDLNFPPTDDEEDDPFGGLLHGQDHPPPAGAYPMGAAYGAPSLHLNMATYEPVHEEDGFIAPTAASNIDLNFALEEEESGTVHARIRLSPTVETK
ncbi:hypothetical protein PVAP13_1KG125177 [Panicum virgatum]|uniref:Uncharacterized protein n=1 Tax=Panicum virgatum TaxID=38727 RepID=A0A8T0X9W0_PANVG|nr:hypothetical protein PVAP13_1KG125177 [Panicum virgatum]